MQRKDVEREFDRKMEAIVEKTKADIAAAFEGCPKMVCMSPEQHQALLDRAERAEAERDALRRQLADLHNGWANSVKAHANALAERDAAFAAGQEAMRERAAALVEPGQHDGWYAAAKRQMQTAIRALPINPRPTSA